MYVFISTSVRWGSCGLGYVCVGLGNGWLELDKKEFTRALHALKAIDAGASKNKARPGTGRPGTGRSGGKQLNGNRAQMWPQPH